MFDLLLADAATGASTWGGLRLIGLLLFLGLVAIAGWEVVRPKEERIQGSATVRHDVEVIDWKVVSNFMGTAAAIAAFVFGVWWLFFVGVGLLWMTENDSK